MIECRVYIYFYEIMFYYLFVHNQNGIGMYIILLAVSSGTVNSAQTKKRERILIQGGTAAPHMFNSWAACI